MSKSIVFSAKNAVVRKELNTILSGINIEFAQGELVALVGSAGSGKTTLGQLVSGDIDAYDGEIYVRQSLKRTFVSQQDNFFSMTGMSLTYYGQRYEYSEEIKPVIKQLVISVREVDMEKVLELTDTLISMLGGIS